VPGPGGQFGEVVGDRTAEEVDVGNRFRVARHAEGDAVAVGEDGDAEPHGRPDRHVRDDLAQPPAESANSGTLGPGTLVVTDTIEC
jgi:hypothetical protein